MREPIKRELRKALAALDEADPRTCEYAQLLRNIEVLVGQAEMFDEISAMLDGADSREAESTGKGYSGADIGADIVGETPPSVFNKDEVREKESATAESAAPGVANAEEESRHEVEAQPRQYKPEEVRAALVASRRRGVNVTAVLEEFGVENFSSFPAGRYWELMDKLGAGA